MKTVLVALTAIAGGIFAAFVGVCWLVGQSDAVRRGRKWEAR